MKRNLLRCWLKSNLKTIISSFVIPAIAIIKIVSFALLRNRIECLLVPVSSGVDYRGRSGLKIGAVLSRDSVATSRCEKSQDFRGAIAPVRYQFTETVVNHKFFSSDNATTNNICTVRRLKYRLPLVWREVGAPFNEA
jgi:hypothetical protein